MLSTSRIFVHFMASLIVRRELTSSGCSREERGREEGYRYHYGNPSTLSRIGEVPPLMSACDSTHAFYVPHIGVFQGEFDSEEGVDVLWLEGGGRGEKKFR